MLNLEAGKIFPQQENYFKFHFGKKGNAGSKALNSQENLCGEENNPRLSRIQVDYAGNYSGSMGWDMQLLRRFEDIADLRTKVLIQNGTAAERISIQTLGDTLVLKRARNLSDLFGVRQSTPEMDIETNFASGEAKIIIQDQILTSGILKNKKQINPVEYARKLNKLIIDGLFSVIYQEKFMQAQMSLYLDAKISIASIGLLIMAIGVIKGLDYVLVANAVELYKNIIGQESNYGFIPTTDLNILKGAGYMFGGSGISYVILDGVDQIPTWTEKGYNNIYFSDRNDRLNPSSHLLKASQAKLFLTGKKIVVPKGIIY